MSGCEDYKLFIKGNRERAKAVACMLNEMTGNVNRPTEQKAFSKLPYSKNSYERDLKNVSPDVRHGYDTANSKIAHHKSYWKDVNIVTRFLDAEGGYFDDLHPVINENGMKHYETLYDDDIIVDRLREKGYKWVMRSHVRSARRIIFYDKS